MNSGLCIHVLWSFVENEDFQKQNYSFKIIQDTIVTQKLLNVYPIDDNVVEINEIYNLTIELMDTTHDRVLTGENQTTTITLYDDDSKQLCNIIVIISMSCELGDNKLYVYSTFQPELRWYMLGLASPTRVVKRI